MRWLLVSCLGLSFLSCGDDPKKRLGATCNDDGECESGLCVVSLCMEPSADTDSDGLVNQIEARLGTNPLLADSDADGKRDIDELDDAGANVDSDGDGEPDSVESATADEDGDCIPDERDPENMVADPSGCGGGLTLGAPCAANGQCRSGLCVDVCLDPAGDEDADGLTNALEVTLRTDPRRGDTDGDGKSDASEVDGTVHRDTDHDGKGDALESSLADADGDCIPDEQDHDDAAVDPNGCNRPRTMWNVTFEPMIDVTVCRGGSPLFWCCQNLAADATGAFDETWAGNEPNTARVSGTVGETTFQATIACTSGAPSGTLTATRTGAYYAGTFSFSGQSGSIIVFPGEVDTITVQGRVAQVGTNLPIAGAVVRASVDEVAQATTGPTGLFYLETSAPTGSAASYRIIITASGYQTLDQDHTWGDHPTQQSFQLMPATR